MAACPSCREENPDRARFCLNCGKPLTEGPAPGEERKVVTVLFADVTGSTGLAERLDAERTKEVLTAYLHAMREEIEAEGGTVEKFIGDAVMAVFGVPTAHEDDPTRALRAALRMRRRLAILNADLEQTYKLRLRARIGVNTGEVVASLEPRAGEGMVTGDAVNVAARFEQGAEPDQILVSERTMRAVRGIAFGDPHDVQVRGKGEPVRGALLLDEEVGPATQGARGVPGLHAPMVGRDGEMGLLEALYRRVAQEGRPHLITVYGEPGVGKSRLAKEFVAWVRTQQPAPSVLRGRCLPYGDGITFWPLAEIIKGFAGVLDSDSPTEAVAKIRTASHAVLTPQTAVDEDRTVEALAYSVRLTGTESPLEPLPPRQTTLEIHAAWRSFFSALAARGPVVVTVEDIHWGDPALLDLLEELADRIVGPVLFVCPARPELTAKRPSWGGGRRNVSSVFLEPLPADQADRLIDTLLAVADLPPSVHARIIERAEGNPFFIEEIVRRLIDEGAVVRDGGGWRAVEGLEDLDIPDSVQAVLAARIDLLPRPDKRTLQLASVVGRIFWDGPVTILLDDAGDVVDTTLGRLEERQLVLSHLGSVLVGQREYIFKHILTRDVAYSSLPRRERTRAHIGVAEWIERMAGGRLDEFVELLAYHDLEAYRGLADDPKASEEDRTRIRSRAYAEHLEAARTALGRGAADAARHLAMTAAELAATDLERAEANELLGDAALTQFLGDEAWGAYRMAADLRMVDPTTDPLTLARICGKAANVPTRWAGSIRQSPSEAETSRYLEAGFRAVGDADSPELAALLIAESVWTHGYPSSAETEADRVRRKEAGERAVEVARRLGRPDLESGGLDAVDHYFVSQGRYMDSLPLVQQRLALLAEAPDPVEVQDVDFMAGWTTLGAGMYREALAACDEAVVRETQLGVRVVVAVSFRAVARYHLGDWDGALADTETMRAGLGEPADDPPSASSQCYAAAALIQEVRGQREEADELLAICDRVDDRVTGRRSGDVVPATRAHLTARILARRGRAEEALTRLGEPPGPPIQVESLGWALAARCDVIAEGGLWDRAAEVAHQARTHAERTGVGILLAYADRLEGRAAFATGGGTEVADQLRRALAVEALGRASRRFEEAGAVWDWALTDLALAEALGGGRVVEAAGAENSGNRSMVEPALAKVVRPPKLEKALAVFERLGAVRETEAARALLERLA